jgi:hypothetical protein
MRKSMYCTGTHASHKEMHAILDVTESHGMAPNTTRLRQQFGQDGKFLSALVQMIKKGRVKPDHPRARWVRR